MVSIVLSISFPLECDTALSVKERATQLAKEDARHSQVAQTGIEEGALRFLQGGASPLRHWFG